jgi:flavin reductase (DIM6/NTAB) family NADH-FMN oxidoreductase RutF
MSESTSESTSESMAALFRRLTCGVYVVGVAHAERRRAFTAAWVTQVSFDPLLLALSVNPANASHALLVEGRVFSVNVLARGQMDLARRFGTPSEHALDRLADVAWRVGVTGAPILRDALAYFDCRLDDRHRAGDHELVIGRVVDGAVLASAGVPMSYAETGDLDGSSALYPSSFERGARR